DRVSARPVAIRMPVCVARLPVCRPARVRDPGRAAHLLRPLPPALPRLAPAPIYAPPALVRHYRSPRVVAPGFCAALPPPRGGAPLADVADDSAHDYSSQP